EGLGVRFFISLKAMHNIPHKPEYETSPQPSPYEGEGAGILSFLLKSCSHIPFTYIQYSPLLTKERGWG
ncbi:hypothetical protein, partial [Nodularia spumigena]|uniref:hypothetical protein n=1 Tax=Nodularia spumigena TaxID=70799 RepID=UPI002B1EE866